MLAKFELTTCSEMKTPMAPPLKLDKDSNGKSVDVTLYRGMIGSLLYLTASRPDIMYATCLCARYQADPKESHMKAVNRIFRYLKGTPNLGLWYPRDSGFDLTAFSDSDFAGCKIDRKSTTGGCQLLGGKLVSWTSKKQNSVFTSTAEAEYVAAGSCCAQVIWMRNQLLDYGFQLSKIPIYCDNTSTIAIANNPVLHSKTKHIEIRYHFIRDHVMNGDVELHFVPTKYQLADLFTKPLDEKRFNQLIKSMASTSRINKNSTETNNEWDAVNEPILSVENMPIDIISTENPIATTDAALVSNPTEEGSNMDLSSSEHEDAEDDDDESQHDEDNLSTLLSLSLSLLGIQQFPPHHQSPPGKEYLAAARDFLLRCLLKTAFTINFSPNSALWVSAKVVILKNSLGKDAECIQCRLPKSPKGDEPGTLTFGVGLLRRVLGLPVLEAYCKEPSKEAIIAWLEILISSGLSTANLESPSATPPPSRKFFSTLSLGSSGLTSSSASQRRWAAWIKPPSQPL
ncbi:hypothetical protein OSB04_012369 [Centaurea solstitialis]|uniref:Copia protein n=1 Tax=Centaurea solstitialis TaxID=347529 RepID=A0AA38TMZ3_9ASTR|nr:hypothetical protein OSB04_012369 [Centaurea solstitialis]